MRGRPDTPREVREQGFELLVRNQHMLTHLPLYAGMEDLLFSVRALRVLRVVLALGAIIGVIWTLGHR
jgi:hypothetical protein